MQIVNLAKRLCIHQEDDDSVGVVHLLAICQATLNGASVTNSPSGWSERFKP